MAILQASSISGSAVVTGSVVTDNSAALQLPVYSGNTPTAGDGFQIWFDNTNIKIKYSLQGAPRRIGAWRTGPQLDAQKFGLQGSGTNTAGLAIGGQCQPCKTEEFDGVTLTSGGNTLCCVCFGAAVGTQNASRVMGGYPNRCLNQTYNGAGWSYDTQLSYCMGCGVRGAGSYNAAILAGGEGTAPACTITCVQNWDGTTWSDGCVLPSIRRQGAFGGTSNDLFYAGGECCAGTPPTATVCKRPETYRYDGLTWQTCSNMIETISKFGTAGCPDNAIVFGGVIGNAPTEVWRCKSLEFNGTTWIWGQNKNYSGFSFGSIGKPDNAWSLGGCYYNCVSTQSRRLDCTEVHEYAYDKPYPHGVWKQSGAMPYCACCSYGVTGDGCGAMTLGCSGNYTQRWDGNTWNTCSTLPGNWSQACCSSGFGTDNAGIITGGKNCYYGIYTNLWNGTSWECGDYNIYPMFRAGAGGTQDNGIYFGGGECARKCDIGEHGSLRTHYYGSYPSSIRVGTWTNIAGSPNAMCCTQGTGTETAFVAAGGNVCCTNEWNGNSWNTGATTPRHFCGGGMVGTQNSAMIQGGVPNANCVARYDGIAYTSYGANTPIYKCKHAMVGTSCDHDDVLLWHGNCNGNATLCFDGSAWSCVAEFPYCNMSGGFAGNSSAAISIGGLNNCPATWTDAEGGQQRRGDHNCLIHSWNGTTWSDVGNVLFKKYNSGGQGTQNNALVIGGNCDSHQDGSSQVVYTSEGWDGITLKSEGNLPYHKACRPATGGGRNVSGNDRALVTHGSTNCTLEYCELCTITHSWTTGPNMNTRRLDGAGSANSCNDAFMATGQYCNCACDTCCLHCNSESFDGTAWTVGSNVTQPRCKGAAAGGGTSGIIFGGEYTGTCGVTCAVYWTEEYDGTAWAVVPGMNIARTCLGGTGTQSHALAVGGCGRGTFIACECSEEYIRDQFVCCSYSKNIWTALPNVPQAQKIHMGWGVTDAAVSAGGNVPTGCTTNLFNWDGSSWSAGDSLLLGKQESYGVGTQNAGIIFAGLHTAGDCYDCVECYNGSSWSAGTIVPISVYNHSAAGDQDCAVIFGGRDNRSFDCCTLSYGSAGYYSTFSSGPNLPQCACAGFGTGTTNAVLSVGLGCATQEYNGASWSCIAATNNCYYHNQGNGTVNDAITTGGCFAPNGCVNCVEIWNGTSWSSGTAMTYKKCNHGTTGASSNSSVTFAGCVQGCNGTHTEEWDGSTWTLTTCTPYTFRCGGAAGIVNATIAAGGDLNPMCCLTMEYNGSTWSTGPQLYCKAASLVVAGTTNSAAGFGGNTTCKCAQEWDGTAWGAGARSTCNFCSCQHGTGNNSTDGIVFGGCCFCATEFYSQCATPKAWSFESAMLCSHRCFGSFGSYNAAHAIGGDPNNCINEFWNGTAWSRDASNLRCTRFRAAAWGTANSGVVVGGCSCCAEEYDGTTYSLGGKFANYTSMCGIPCTAAAGSNNSSGIVFGGCAYPTGSCSQMQQYGPTSYPNSIGTSYRIGSLN